MGTGSVSISHCHLELVSCHLNGSFKSSRRRPGSEPFSLAYAIFILSHPERSEGGEPCKHMERFKLINSGYLFLVDNRKILLSRRFHTGFEDGKYSVPAGHLDAHETVRHCCAREAKEEIGITILEEQLELVHVMHRKNEDERVDFFFVANSWSDKVINMEPSKCDDLQWFPLDQLPSNVIPYIKTAIENYQKKIIYSDFGWK